ncbi:glycoside hydrolase family 130 protein [Bythopirellula polymerisocia]|uniref:Beta-1,4-mannooligosaccharide phosphorylase n=1 Tax=Bythopirellula polymerisocia TaxID=2528003 RepID=A0A5C6D280_9BACT|nr:glycoside hydrolase family 130 protein [Bythopirellula polymerisocia]TWU29767.1 Beta-1,4-mannooligosaccharide phosphorylase [Bythopirellula polymerisocia]
MQLERTGIVLAPNSRRVVLRNFTPPGDQRKLKIIARIAMLSEAEVDRLLENVFEEFNGRHQKPREFFLRRYEAVRSYVLTDTTLSENRRILIGAYFTQEYALESAALFNPSIVWHPDQTNLPEGSKRFALSLRATGEGHISSITFRSGVVDNSNAIRIDDATRFVTTPDAVPDSLYEKALFQRKLIELGLANSFAEHVLSRLEENFTLKQLEATIQITIRENRDQKESLTLFFKSIIMLAKSNYELTYSPEHGLSERLIFPFGPTESNGIEDARFVEFQEEDGSTHYYATYSAYDGKMVLPQLLETDDFLHFKMHTLNGPEIADKGLALFPRKLNGHYAMLSRQDGENLFLMYSDMLHFWYSKEILLKPTFPWEFVQVGNCGSPIETDVGWLVLSHGVGPMRKYSIGAFLVDLDDPSRLIGRLKQPLVTPNENEREGYVPNVVYSCGAVVHNGQLIVPYAMSDYATTFGTVPLDELLAAMEPV